MEWCQEVVFEFLDLYENEPVIWQPRHPQHKNRNLINDAWVRIKNKISMKCTVADLKKKKESLMASFRPLWRKVKESSKTGSGSDDVYKPAWFAYERMESFLHGVSLARNTYNSEIVENSMDQQETEEDSLTESASASGDDGTSTDIQGHTDMGGKDTNEIEASTESQSANKEGGIGKSTNSKQNHFKVPLGGAKKYKRKAVEMNETERRMEEAYEIMKQCRNTEPPKTTLCTAYGQLASTRLETLSEVNRMIMMNEIDNLFFRAAMGYMRPQYQSASPGPASPASATSFIHQPPQYQSASPGPTSPASSTSSIHQPSPYQSASPGPASPASATSFIHQPPQYQSASPGPTSPASSTSSIHQPPQYQSATPGPASPAYIHSSSSNETFETENYTVL